MAAYLDVAAFQLRTVIPPEDIAAIEVRHPGWLAARLEGKSRWIDAQLRKRYRAPFAAPYPEAVLDWLCDIVTPIAYLKIGVRPTDEQYGDMRESATRAEQQIQEAANSETGLYDLPLRADTTESGIELGGPFGYSEQSPYVCADEQARVGRDEDRQGRGTGG
jgi:hypothetical protein